MIISGHLATDVEIKRFKREARAVAALEHNNIVSIYEVDQVETLHYFTMNYFEGVTLDTWTKMRPHDLADRVSVLIQLCEGIDYAHQRGIIHRDLKPANILVDQDGCVQIIDFGLAKEFDCLRTAITGEHLIGTPQYMAPEQLLGHQAKFGPRSDIYAIGAVLYELVTDRKPFAANTLFELMQQVDSVEPAPPHLMGTDFAAWNRRNLSPLPGQRSVPKIHLRHRNRRGAARTASRSWGRNESHHGPKAAYQIPGLNIYPGRPRSAFTGGWCHRHPGLEPSRFKTVRVGSCPRDTHLSGFRNDRTDVSGTRDSSKIFGPAQSLRSHST